MKQFVTFAFPCASTGALNVVQAQISLEILGAPDTVQVSLDTLVSPDVQAYWDVTNVGEESLDVMVTRSFMEIADPFNFPYSDEDRLVRALLLGTPVLPVRHRGVGGPRFSFGHARPCGHEQHVQSGLLPQRRGRCDHNQILLPTARRPSNAVCHEVTFVVDATSDVTELPIGVACSLMPNPATDMVTLTMDRGVDVCGRVPQLVGQVAKRERIRWGDPNKL